MTQQPQQDESAEFVAACNAPQEYPKNLVRAEAFYHTLDSLHFKLNEAGRFSPTYRKVFVRDLRENDHGVLAYNGAQSLKNIAELKAQLTSHTEDPWWRFIHSKGSREPLGCSREQLAYLLCYHQVMPSFLDFVFCFRTRWTERPFPIARFRHENYLEADSSPLRLPSRGRSGIQIQHAFSLLGVEKSQVTEEMNQWPLRQAVLYHSLDLETGRSVWIHFKGGPELRDRLVNVTRGTTGSNRYLRPDGPKTRERAFIASLHLQLLFLEWSVENWPEYIDKLEEEAGGKSIHAKVAPVTALTNALPSQATFSRHSTFRSQRAASRQNSIQAVNQTAPPNSSPGTSSIAAPVQPRRTHSIANALRRMSGLERDASGLTQQSQPTSVQATYEDPLEELNEKFNFNELQRLSLMGDEIDRARDVLERNKEVIGQIRAQYEAVLSSHGFKLVNKRQCKGEITNFFRRLRSIEGDIGAYIHRLEALSRSVDNDKQLFDALNQFTSMKSNNAFSAMANTSSNQMMKWTSEMRTIALKTKQETLSIHIITIFTLIFLPGTFLATFFSSGVLHWDDDGRLGSEWVVRQRGIGLFLSICLPMMAVIITGWAILYCIARRRGRRQQDVEDGYPDEKASLIQDESSGLIDTTAPGTGLGISAPTQAG